MSTFKNPFILCGLFGCCKGHPEMVKLLCSMGVDVNTVGQYGRTPLYRAAFGGHTEAARVRNKAYMLSVIERPNQSTTVHVSDYCSCIDTIY